MQWKAESGSLSDSLFPSQNRCVAREPSFPSLYRRVPMRKRRIVARSERFSRQRVRKERRNWRGNPYQGRTHAARDPVYHSYSAGERGRRQPTC